jgi:Cyclic nucleotide-binding domain
MAELTEQLELESVPPPHTPTVSEGRFATVFDVPLFAQLDDSQRACFSTGTEIRLKAGETFFRDGDPADAFYVMLEGELRATKYYGDQEIFLGEGGSWEVLWRDSNTARHPELGARPGGRRQPAFSSATRRILGPATHRAYGGEGNHANARNTVAQFGELLTGAREAHPTWRDGGRTCS